MCVCESDHAMRATSACGHADEVTRMRAARRVEMLSDEVEVTGREELQDACLYIQLKTAENKETKETIENEVGTQRRTTRPRCDGRYSFPSGLVRAGAFEGASQNSYHSAFPTSF